MNSATGGWSFRLALGTQYQYNTLVATFLEGFQCVLL